jgi:uncharacterized metal-binding protein YceD (DUF177 family)
MAAGKQPEAEFSRRVRVDTLGDDELVRRIEATAKERKALAARFDLLSLDRLEATLHLRRPAGRSLIRVAGRFEAEVTQACMVTLEPVAGHLESGFLRCYGSAAGQAAEREIQVDIGEDEQPEPVPPGGIDLGEIVAEQLALNLDPYPRAEGARLEQAEWGGAPGGERRSPFAALDSLKERK